ncbi:MAG: flagella cluster protein [Haloarculaceae archaeon]
MERLGDGDGPIDVHEHRHGLKLHRETRETALWENKAPYACPACGEAFEQLYVTEKRDNTFSPSRATPFCVRREPERLLVFRH